MPEKYFATIVRKIPVGETDFFYKAESIIAGDIDEDSRILTATNGEKYKPINDFSDYEHTTRYYVDQIEVDKISDFFHHKYDFSEAVRQYELRKRQVVYVSTKMSGNDYILLPIDRGPYITALEKIKSNPSAYPEEDLTVITVAEEEKMAMTDEDEEQFITNLKGLIADVVSGKYSPDELIDIKCKLQDQKEELEAAIDSISLQSDVLEEELDEKTSRPEEQTISVPNPTPLKPKNESTELIDINDIFSKVTKTLIAQDKAARRAIVEIARLDDMSKKEQGILLTGGTGVGKSLLMRLISRHLNRPVLLIDSTQLTAPAYVGRSIEQYLWQLYEECDHNLSKAEHAIIYFDEIDKKGSEKKSDVSGQAVLNTLLKFVEGTDYIACQNPQSMNPNNSVKISTNNMIVTAGGAFLDVYTQHKKKQPIGFNSSVEEENQEVEPDITDFVNKAMMTNEFMGRFPIIIHLDDLNVDGIRQILLASDESALKIQEEVFGKRGVKLSTKDGYILAVANKALERKIGARGLNKIVADSTWKAYDEVCCNPGTYDEVILTEETIKDSSSYQLIKKKTN